MSIGEFSMSEVSLSQQAKAQLSKPRPRRIYTAKTDATAVPEAR
jgi:hypothetical protein